MKFLVTSLLLLLLLEGCSQKSPTLVPKTIESNNTTIIEESLELTEDEPSDFDDEFTEEEVTSDPFSGYNRFMTGFNDKLYSYAFNPISKVYAFILPNALQQGISNMFYNIKFPVRFTNNLLQGKFQNTLEESERFILNSTIGVIGLFDVATHYWHIPSHHEDFGQTLGYYGFGSGYHIVLPLLGPSNIRDIVGLTFDGYASPIVYQSRLQNYNIAGNLYESTGLYTLDMINLNALNPTAYETLKKDAMDLYPFLKNAYEQKRSSDISE